MGRPERTVQKRIADGLRRLGFFVSDFSQSRRGRCPRCGCPLSAGTQQTEGIPDLFVVHERWQIALWVEVKAGDNRPSESQKRWHETVRGAGQSVVVAWSLQDVIEALAELGAPVS